jgi:hypothetical protein
MRVYHLIIMYVIITLAAVLLFNTPAQCKEQSLSVQYGFYTNHIGYSDIEYNENNNLIGVEYKINDWYFNIATYENSFYNRSNAFGAGYNLLSGYGFDFDVLFGLVTGYTDETKTICANDICGYIAPRVSYTFNVGENIGIKPTAQLFYNAVVLSIGAEYRF